MKDYDELSTLFESEDGKLFQPKTKKHVATADDRLIESFSEISDFVERNGRKPDANAEDMKEAVLGTRLNAIRIDKKKVDALAGYDALGLLEIEKVPETLDELFSDDSGLFENTEGIFDLTTLPESKRVVQNAADSARRRPSKDFGLKYKNLFLEQQAKLASGELKLTLFHNVDQLAPGNFYVYDGMMCYVVEFGEKVRKAGGYSQQRLLVIFENGTESNMYRRSLAQRLYEGGMVVVGADYDNRNDEVAVGRIYILKSLSDDPKITTIKDLYKIGVTTGSVEERIKNAANDPTYLMAPVKLVASYKLTGEYNPQKVEDMIHKIFSSVALDLKIVEKNGREYKPIEWYCVPLHVIRQAVDLIDSGEIVDYYYDNNLEKMTEHERG